jgi:hypothetical protein
MTRTCLHHVPVYRPRAALLVRSWCSLRIAWLTLIMLLMRYDYCEGPTVEQARSDPLKKFVKWSGFELIAPLIVFVDLHYAFFNWYAAPYLTWESFHSTFTEGIYRYRVLGPHIVEALHDGLPSGIQKLTAQPEYMGRLLPEFDLSVYTTMVVVNFVAFAATLVIGRSLLRSSLGENYQPLYWLLTGWMLASTAVLTPYDFLAYFFLVATIAALEWKHSVAAYPALLILTVLGTLTRETQALAIAYAVSTLIAASAQRARMIVPRALVVAAAFFATYISLRVKLGWGRGLFDEITVGFNESALSLFGLSLAAAMMILVHLTAVRRSPDLPGLRRRLVVLHVLALPYWVVVAFAGNFFELRLFIPLAIVHAAAIVNQGGTSSADQVEAHRTSIVRAAS